MFKLVAVLAALALTLAIPVAQLNEPAPADAPEVKAEAKPEAAVVEIPAAVAETKLEANAPEAKSEEKAEVEAVPEVKVEAKEPAVAGPAPEAKPELEAVVAEVKTEEVKVEEVAVKTEEVAVKTEEIKAEEVAVKTEEIKAEEVAVKTEEIKAEEVAVKAEEIKAEEVAVKTEEIKAEEVAVKAEEVKAEEIAVKTEEIKAEEIAVKEEIKAETAEVKAEAPAVEAKVEEIPVEAPAATAEMDAVKQEALDQVLSFVESLARPLNTDEHAALKDMIAAGGDILAQAERKALDLQSQLGETNLLQQENLFGMKPDGSIDADAAADQMLSLLALIAGPDAVSAKEKTVIHDLIAGFAKLFSPDKATISALQHDFGKIMGSVEQVMGKPQSHADLLDTQTLLTVFEDPSNLLQNVQMSELTKTFLNNIQTEFETATQALAEFH